MLTLTSLESSWIDQLEREESRGSTPRRIPARLSTSPHSLSQMAPLAFTTVDAFTTKPFSGNPASVVVFAADDARGKDTPLLQRLGLEFNLSETAMLVPLEDSTEPKPRYSLRWFTPAVVRSSSISALDSC